MYAGSVLVMKDAMWLRAWRGFYDICHAAKIYAQQKGAPLRRSGGEVLTHIQI